MTDPWSTLATPVWTGLGADARIASIAQTPIVMQLTDDDGDGDVDADDNVDVAFLAWNNGGGSGGAHLVVIDARTGAEELDLGGFYFAGEIAAGDIDGDGEPEILAFDAVNGLDAHDLDGGRIWSTDPLTDYIGGQPAVAIADLEGDGSIEVLAQETILDGATGAVIGSLPERPFSFTQHVVADLDLDGIAEILYDGDAHAADGTVLWEGLAPGAGSAVFSMVLDADGDPEGEVVQVADMQMKVYDTDGTELAGARWGGGYASVPCAGDFDGDGAPEVAVPAQVGLRVFELDGTEIANLPIEDTSTMAGCVGADLDGDGAVEIVHADEVSLYVFDARTGTTLVEHAEHASGTLVETPALADIDDDGTVEILLGSNDNMGRDAWIGLTVIEHDGAGWTAGPADWPANARVDGRFGPGGSVDDIGTWWTRENTFRALGTTGGVPQLDARVHVADACLATCEGDGVVEVAVTVANPGAIELPASTEVALYRVDGGVRTLVGSRALGVDLASGEQAASLRFQLTWGDVGGDGFEATVAEGGADCHPEDNVDAWDDLGECPEA